MTLLTHDTWFRRCYNPLYPLGCATANHSKGHQPKLIKFSTAYRVLLGISTVQSGSGTKGKPMQLKHKLDTQVRCIYK